MTMPPRVATRHPEAGVARRGTSHRVLVRVVPYSHASTLCEVPRRLRWLGMTRGRGGTLLALLAFLVCFPVPVPAAEDSLGDKIKKIFEPTPTPTPKKRKPSTTKKSSPSPTPSPTAKPKASASPSATPKRSPSPEPSATPKKDSSKSSSKADEEPSVTPKPESSPSASASPKGKKKKSSPTPEPSPSASPSASESPEPTATPSPGESPTLDATPIKKQNARGASIGPEDIEGVEKYAPEVRKIVDVALGLTSQNLEYKYGSADPASGGLDCSGFVYYVLNQTGAKDVPRDSSNQYKWVRKSGKFQAVISRSNDTFELDELKPGDLLFWTGTYDVQRDPPITHAMIYLGREKKTKQRVMVGASDGRTYHGESRFGVGVFDFKVSRSGSGSREGRTPTFVGYGRVPGLGDG